MQHFDTGGDHERTKRRVFDAKHIHQLDQKKHYRTHMTLVRQMLNQIGIAFLLSIGLVQVF